MTATNNHLIQLDGVNKVFLTDEVETHALSDIDFQIRKGEYILVTGPSGCGKSTTLRMVAGLTSIPQYFAK